MNSLGQDVSLYGASKSRTLHKKRDWNVVILTDRSGSSPLTIGSWQATAMQMVLSLAEKNLSVLTFITRSAFA
jgi:hypothetical protein